MGELAVQQRVLQDGMRPEWHLFSLLCMLTWSVYRCGVGVGVSVLQCRMMADSNVLKLTSLSINRNLQVPHDIREHVRADLFPLATHAMCPSTVRHGE